MNTDESRITSNTFVEYAVHTKHVSNGEKTGEFLFLHDYSILLTFKKCEGYRNDRPRGTPRYMTNQRFNYFPLSCLKWRYEAA
jgi:hypothetical protein